MLWMMAVLIAGPGIRLFAGGAVGLGETPASLDRGNHGITYSLDLSLEIGRAFLAASAQHLGLGGADASLYSVRAGWFLTQTRVAPYFAAGIGAMSTFVDTTEDCYDEQTETGCYSFSNDGPALIGEAGLALWRGRNWGKLDLAVQGVLPRFRVQTIGYTNQYRYSVIGAGLILLRFEL